MVNLGYFNIFYSSFGVLLRFSHALTWATLVVRIDVLSWLGAGSFGAVGNSLGVGSVGGVMLGVGVGSLTTLSNSELNLKFISS